MGRVIVAVTEIIPFDQGIIFKTSHAFVCADTRCTASRANCASTIRILIWTWATILISEFPSPISTFGSEFKIQGKLKPCAPNWIPGRLDIYAEGCCPCIVTCLSLNNMESECLCSTTLSVVVLIIAIASESIVPVPIPFPELGIKLIIYIYIKYGWICLLIKSLI